MADDFTLGLLNRVKNLERFPGGKGINIAMMLSAMGIETVATGFLGHAAGSFFKGHLKKAGVTTNFIHINDVTRHNYFIIDEKSNTRTLLDEEGPEIKPRELEYFKDNFNRILHHTKILIIAGSNPPGVPEGFCCELIEMANKCGVKTILNTEEDNMIKCLPASPYMILPDLRTADSIMSIPINSDTDRNKLTCSLLSKGVNIAAVSFDGESYLVSTPERCYVTRPQGIQTKTRLKSGDAMIAGMAFEFLKGSDIKKAVHTGAATVATVGKTFTGFFTSIEEVNKNMDKIEIEEVSP